MNAQVAILRFNPSIDEKPHFEQVRYELEERMTVLDVLTLVRDTQDETLAFSYGCRYKHCGLCGMVINGTPDLACRRLAEPEMKLEPLANLPVLKDLIVDRDAYETLRPALLLSLERDTSPQSLPETVDMEAFQRFKVASRCIECYCCVSVCPVLKRRPHDFIGPAALVLEARHHFDPRDGLDRRLIFKDAGIDRCTQCGLCSRVCPMGADPCGTIRRVMQSMPPENK